MDQLRHPVGLPALSVRLGRPLLRRDAPSGRGCPLPPRTLPADPGDIEDFISDVGATEGRAIPSIHATLPHAHPHTPSSRMTLPLTQVHMDAHAQVHTHRPTRTLTHTDAQHMDVHTPTSQYPSF